MLVERSGEVALKQLVVKDGLGQEAANKLKVAEVVRIEVGGRVDGVGDPVSWGDTEQHIVWVEDLP